MFSRLTSTDDIRARTRGTRGSVASAFTLIDVLVSIAVVGILIALLMPSLSVVSESARRVACRSNVRQAGIGIAMYAQDANGQIPNSVFAPMAMAGPGRSPKQSGEQPGRLQTLRVWQDDVLPVAVEYWDGLGKLYSLNYLPAGKVFYCPSHRGQNRHSVYADRWAGQPGTIVGNYHYRGRDPQGRTKLDWMEPADITLVSDGLSSPDDFSHRLGANVLRADLAAGWIDDADGSIVNLLARNTTSSDSINQAWKVLDEAASDGLNINK